jgi:phosphoglycolate phosphatase
MTKNLYIFDWDGTIVDSASRIVNCLRQAAAEVGLPPRDDAQLADVIGLGLPEALHRLYPQASAGEREALRERYSRRYVEADQQPSPLFPTVRETLHALKNEGHWLAVATGKSRRGLERVMGGTGLADLFDTSRCADETSSKPDPQMIEEILVELDVPATRAVMIGDSEYDMSMAMNAGILRIAVSYGVHSPERLFQYQPALCLNRMSELLDWRMTDHV